MSEALCDVEDSEAGVWVRRAGVVFKEQRSGPDSFQRLLLNKLRPFQQP